MGQLFSLSAVSHLLKVAAADRRHRLSRHQPAGSRLAILPALLHGSRQRAGRASPPDTCSSWRGKRSLVLLVWSAADYFLERQRHESELKMSRQDLRDEFKEIGRQSRGQDAHPPPAAPGPPPPHAEGRRARRGRDHQPHRIRHRARVPHGHGRARRRGQGTQPAGGADPRNRAAGTAFRWSRIRRWPTPSTAPSKSGRPFHPSSTPWSPRFWRPSGGPRHEPRAQATQTAKLPLRRRTLSHACQRSLPRPPPLHAKVKLNGASEWIMPIAAVGLIFVMLVPLPSILLDVLLATSITAAVLVLLSAIQILRPSQFSVFPSLLLLLTLFRLSLNLASSRRILLHGNEGAGAAGHVIEAFGQFVVGGNYVVGFVIFIALIAIQYIVVAHGAVRTAEVTARFTLDAMPGKQMAIDADLNAGLINEAQARARREQIARDAEFYGAMDGAARFNQRDAIATILITAINIIAGFLIGVFQLDIPFREALKTYTVLTVGDGLVTMIPSLLVSMAGGMVVTRASSDATLSVDVGRQLLSRPSAADRLRA